MPDYEELFGEFINGNDYDRAENALFSIARISFRAGWLAAGGSPPPVRTDVQMVRPERVVIPYEGNADAAETGSVEES
jgi:hypothetical protein